MFINFLFFYVKTEEKESQWNIDLQKNRLDWIYFLDFLLSAFYTFKFFFCYRRSIQ